jgi:hypothetical protein
LSFQTKHDQAVSDFKSQCDQIRTELEAAYRLKTQHKLDRFKADYAQFREKELKYEYEQALEQARNRSEGLEAEVKRLKKDVRMLQIKNKQMKMVEQENITRIEEEVNKSLAKVMNSQAANKAAPKRSQSPYQVNRSYQSVGLNTQQASTVSF